MPSRSLTGRAPPAGPRKYGDADVDRTVQRQERHHDLALEPEARGPRFGHHLASEGRQHLRRRGRSDLPQHLADDPVGDGGVVHQRRFPRDDGRRQLLARPRDLGVINSLHDGVPSGAIPARGLDNLERTPSPHQRYSRRAGRDGAPTASVHTRESVRTQAGRCVSGRQPAGVRRESEGCSVQMLGESREQRRCGRAFARVGRRIAAVGDPGRHGQSRIRSTIPSASIAFICPPASEAVPRPGR